MPPPLIQTSGVCKVYGARRAPVRALDGIDLAIEGGEFVAIMGPSGSGKSTLMNLLGFLDRPSEGRYLFAGEDVGTFSHDRLAAYRNRHLGFVFQGFNLLARATAAENAALPLLYRGLRRRDRQDRAIAALESVGLRHRQGHRPQQLSGGEQQRVAVARAVVGEPLLLLADEPTGAVDSATGLDILALFQSLNDSGRTIVLITHDRFVAEHANRIISLRDGRVVGDDRVKAPRRTADARDRGST
jgi:putative ABC transport system ATP-binding protein